MTTTLTTRPKVTRISRYSSYLDLAIACSLLALVLTPLIVVPHERGFIVGKMFWFRAWGSICLVLALNRYGVAILRPLPPRLLWLFAAYIAILWVTSLLGVYPLHSILSDYARGFGVLDMTLAALAAFVAWKSLTDASWNLLFQFVFVATIGVCIFGLLAVFKVEPYASMDPARVASTTGNPLYLAAILLMVSLLGLGFLADRSTPLPTRILALLAVVCAFVTLFFTGSRAAVYGLFAGLCALLLVALWKGWEGRSFPTDTVQTILSPLAMFGVLLLLFSPHMAPDKSTLQTVTSRGITFVLDPGRQAIYQAALQQWKERPLLGWGPHNLYYAVLRNNPEVLEQSLFQQSKPDLAHHQGLEHLATTGLLGFAFWAFLWCAAGVKVLATRWPHHRFVAYGCGAAFIGTFVLQLAFFETTTTFFLFSLCLAWLSRRDEAHEEAA